MDSATESPMTFVGLGQTGFNDDGFFVLRGRGGIPARVMLPFEDICQNPRLICERDMPAVPHLLAIINLTALSKGVLPLHASAFTIDSMGVLVTGWAKSGKTESLLGCMSEGARYVGDEWVYLTQDGRMFGLPEPIRLWAWHLQQLPALLRSRPLGGRLRLSAWKTAAVMASAWSHSRIPGSAVMRKGSPIISRQAYLQIPPEEIFGEGTVALQARFEVAILVVSHEKPEIVIESTGQSELSGRMAASLSDERADFLAHYRQFRYARPETTNAAIDNAEATELALLRNLLDNLPSAKVLHPYPCDITALGRAVVSAAHHIVASPQVADPFDDRVPTGSMHG
ncbi:MAG: hypothetical protein H0V07_03065 [Propionibacteriales bacterium]|nr:hypothetical protein [Propionibacteriales bacterium]